MFFNKIARTRKAIKSKKWLERRLERLLYESERINDFRTFHCSKNFVGWHRAKENQQIYDEREFKNSKRIWFVKKQLKLISINKG